MSPAEHALLALAGTPVLLVAVDFDGTLAPIVDVPEDAAMIPRARRALGALARLPHTRVVVISGRALADLDQRLGPLEPDILRVGSHGSEFAPDDAGRLDDAARGLLARVVAALERAADGLDGVAVERKDGSAALHYRRATRDDAARALWRLQRALPALRDGAAPGLPQVKRGKRVVELGVVAADKGAALTRLRAELGATAVACLGDDRTDEDMFAALGPDDVAIKIGPGITRAGQRLPDPAAAAEALVRLAEARRNALTRTVDAAIDDLGFLSDRRTAALVAPDGEVCWLAPERFDRSAIFASLLGGPNAGRFVVRPANGPEHGRQRYLDDSLVLATEWPELTVIDALVPEATGTVLVRELIPAHPGVEVALTFAPRPDFARLPTALAPLPDGVRVNGGATPIVLEGIQATWRIAREGRHETATATVRLDGPIRLILRIGKAGSTTVPEPTTEALCAWWSRGDAPLPDGRWRTWLAISRTVLCGLVHEPTGALVAAATTSLPETPGGVRNWDYRYCWPRDAAYAFDALTRLGDGADAARFMDWMADRVAQDQDQGLRPLYGVAGEHLGAEGELGHLIGYGGARPVRVGNAAAEQLQVDVPGAVVDLAATLAATGAPFPGHWWRMVGDLVGFVAERWMEPDAGIWELRSAMRHHVHSKVMAWLAVDRAIAIGTRLGRPVAPWWSTLRAQIAADVLSRGWNAEAGAFTTAYGRPDADAAALWIVLSGLLAPDDPRATATIDLVDRTLRHGPTVFRYAFGDGLPGADSGGFHICTAWLVEALWRNGRRERAVHLFEGLLSCAGPTGLLSEMFDPSARQALGNTPQAYSHTGVIRAALVLEGRWDALRPNTPEPIAPPITAPRARTPS